MIESPRTEPPAERKEWLQPPTEILVRQRQSLGRWYYVLRPLAIVYASLFLALREVLAVVIYAGFWAFWLVAQVFAWFLGLAAGLLIAYTRLRRGRQAADELRRAAAQSEAEGRAWRQRANARLARRVGWPSDVTKTSARRDEARRDG
jgi:signal transduction histidine kinase